MTNYDDDDIERNLEWEELCDSEEAESKPKLGDRIRTAVEEVTEEKRLDFSLFRAMQINTEFTAYDDNLGVARNFINLCEKSLLFPHQSIQLPIYAVYTLCPSALSTVLPILFLEGRRGSGKSTAMLLSAAVHDTGLFSAASTAVALRNHINKKRWDLPEMHQLEKNFVLLLDNVSANTFNNDYLYPMLLNGYNRDTDRIEISVGNGENLEFRVFGSKIISGIVLPDPKFDELWRRLMIIRTKNFEDMTTEEREGNDTFEPLNLAGVDLSKFAVEYARFWRDEKNLLRFSQIKSTLLSRKIKHKFPSLRWVLLPDLIATGMTFELWDGFDSAIEAFEHYWEFFDSQYASRKPALTLFLERIIDEEIGQALKLREKFKDVYIPLEIAPSLITTRCRDAFKDGEIDNCKPEAIAVAMNSLGWELTSNKSRQLKWRKM